MKKSVYVFCVSVIFFGLYVEIKPKVLAAEDTASGDKKVYEITYIRTGTDWCQYWQTNNLMLKPIAEYEVNLPEPWGRSEYNSKFKQIKETLIIKSKKDWRNYWSKLFPKVPKSPIEFENQMLFLHVNGGLVMHGCVEKIIFTKKEIKICAFSQGFGMKNSGKHAVVACYALDKSDLHINIIERMRFGK